MDREADRRFGQSRANARGIHRPWRLYGEAALSLARTVVRRAERRVVELFDRKEIANPALQQYLNRLSSLLFVLELVENRAAGRETTKAMVQK